MCCNPPTPSSVRCAYACGRVGIAAELLHNVAHYESDVAKYQESLRHVTECLESLRKEPNPHLEIEYCETLIAMNLLYTNHAENAKEMQLLTLRKSAERGNGSHTWLYCLRKYAYIVYFQDKSQASMEAFQEALLASKRIYGEHHPETISCTVRLADCLSSPGNFAQAEDLHREVLRTNLANFGLHSGMTLNSQSPLIRTLNCQGKYIEAYDLAREAVPASEKVIGTDHPETLHVLSLLARAALGRRRFAESAEIYRRVLETREKVLGPHNMRTLGSKYNSALSLYKLGAFPEATALCVEVLMTFDERSLDHTDTLVLNTLGNLAMCLYYQGQEECLEVQMDLVQRLREKYGEKSENYLEEIYWYQVYTEEFKEREERLEWETIASEGNDQNVDGSESEVSDWETDAGPSYTRDQSSCTQVISHTTVYHKAGKRIGLSSNRRILRRVPRYKAERHPTTA
jgi:tetratricopeptide (TPR) repeat protein